MKNLTFDFLFRTTTSCCVILILLIEALQVQTGFHPYTIIVSGILIFSDTMLAFFRRK
jgi:hypothetical protein